MYNKLILFIFLRIIYIFYTRFTFSLFSIITASKVATLCLLLKQPNQFTLSLRIINNRNRTTVIPAVTAAVFQKLGEGLPGKSMLNIPFKL